MTDNKYLPGKWDYAIICKTCGHVGDYHRECHGEEVFGCDEKDCPCKEFETLGVDGFVQYELTPHEIEAIKPDPKHLVTMRKIK